MGLTSRCLRGRRRPCAGGLPRAADTQAPQRCRITWRPQRAHLRRVDQVHAHRGTVDARGPGLVLQLAQSPKVFVEPDKLLALHRSNKVVHRHRADLELGGDRSRANESVLEADDEPLAPGVEESSGAAVGIERAVGPGIAVIHGRESGVAEARHAVALRATTQTVIHSSQTQHGSARTGRRGGIGSGIRTSSTNTESVTLSAAHGPTMDSTK